MKKKDRPVLVAVDRGGKEEERGIKGPLSAVSANARYRNGEAGRGEGRDIERKRKRPPPSEKESLRRDFALSTTWLERKG